jgi:putative aminopeptidase FrvX
MSKCIAVFLAAVCACLVVLAQTKFSFSLVDKAVVLKRIQEVPVKNEDREARVKALFAEVGCGGDALTEQPVKHTKFPNIICRLPGETDEVIIVGAHYDQISPAQGIIDNWSGASLLSSLYQSLAGKKRHHTFLFIAFCEEERGMVGSGFYVGHMTKEELAKTQAMVNMDTLGLSATKIWINAADKDLVKYMAASAQSLQLPVSRMDVDNVGSTDSQSFAAKHIPAITIHSLTQKTLRVLHSPFDTVKQLHPDEYYDTYHLVAGYLAYLDSVLQPRVPGK